MINSDNKVLQKSAVSGEESEAEINRREALMKIGKYSLYTSPVMISLLSGKKAFASGSSHGDDDHHRTLQRQRK